MDTLSKLWTIVCLVYFAKQQCTTDYLLGLSDEKETVSTQSNDERLVAFYEGYNDLDEADKDVLMATFDAFIKARKGDK